MSRQCVVRSGRSRSLFPIVSFIHVLIYMYIYEKVLPIIGDIIAGMVKAKKDIPISKESHPKVLMTKTGIV